MAPKLQQQKRLSRPRSRLDDLGGQGERRCAGRTKKRDFEKWTAFNLRLDKPLGRGRRIQRLPSLRGRKLRGKIGSL